MLTGIIPNQILAPQRMWDHAFRLALAFSITAAILLIVAPAGAWAQNGTGPYIHTLHTEWRADPQPRQLDPQPRKMATTPSAEAVGSSVLSQLLNQGRKLETQHQWGEALSHYEEALHQHPDNPSLRQQHDLAKLHYGLEHRYHDRSFRQSVTSLNSRQALSLYSEMLRKIDTHYVSRPPWLQLATRAITALKIAISDSLFQQANRFPNNSQPEPGRMLEVRRELTQALNRHNVSGPDDLVSLARDVALLLERQVGLSQSATIMEFVTSGAGGLDNYSAYLTGNQLRDVYSQIEGNFVGLGVELKADQGALLIVHVIPGSPAEEAGIREGDRIVAVDGQATSSLSTDEAASLLTGEEGTWVQVTARAPGRQPRVLRVRREHVDVPSLEDAKIVDPDFGVAYVRVPAFQKTTSRDLESTLWELHRQGMRSLILDLRGNPGGLLTASVEVADKFLTQGSIVSTHGRSAQEDFNYQAHYGGTWRVPLVVLIDGDSASASEIFAGAIKDNKRGLLIGDRSYGKGSVQGIFPLGYAGAGIRLTTAKFFSPSGLAISHHGVLPDRTVKTHLAARPTDQGLIIEPTLQDAALNQAIEAARTEASRRRVATR